MTADWAYIKVTNKGGYAGTFSVSCEFGGVTLNFDWGGGFPIDQSKTTRIPGSATNISVDFHCYVIAHHKKHITTETFADASTWPNGTVSYEMTGTTTEPHVSSTS